MPNVVLVDETDAEIGVEEKLRAHLLGRMHRAVSVFVFNDAGELLLQRRAASKYHSGGLWSNTCCGHPEPGEPALDAAHRRLGEEMGVACPLRAAGGFHYRAAVGGGLVEHEYDHLFVGRLAADAEPRPDPTEVDGWRWIAVDALARELRDEPGRFTAWFPAAWDCVVRNDAAALVAAPEPSAPTAASGPPPD